MNHSATQSPVVVEETSDGLCVRLKDYGDADFLEDRLAEVFDVSPILRREERSAEEEEVFVLVFPACKVRRELQSLVDQVR
jgi:hypothetical protein